MIVGFTGLNGSGKTLRAASWVLKYADRFPDRDVLSSLPLDTPRYVPLVSWQQIADRFYLNEATGEWELTEPFVLLLDEVVGLADARETMRLPAHVLMLMTMFRHLDVVVAWTTIDFSFVDVRLRKVTRYIYDCESMFERIGGDQAWGDARVSLAWKHRMSGAGSTKLPPRLLWFAPDVLVVKWARAFGRYPKRRPVGAISEFAPFCPRCGRKRRQRTEYCSCPPVAAPVVQIGQRANLIGGPGS